MSKFCIFTHCHHLILSSLNHFYLPCILPSLGLIGAVLDVDQKALTPSKGNQGPMTQTGWTYSNVMKELLCDPSSLHCISLSSFPIAPVPVLSF